MLGSAGAVGAAGAVFSHTRTIRPSRAMAYDVRTIPGGVRTDPGGSGRLLVGPYESNVKYNTYDIPKLIYTATRYKVMRNSRIVTNLSKIRSLGTSGCMPKFHVYSRILRL